MANPERGFFRRNIEAVLNASQWLDVAIGAYAVVTGKVNLFVLAVTSFMVSLVAKDQLQKKAA